jgi:hypothetical protein
VSFTAWHASIDDAWFFLDSVDEAKSRGIRLERAVRRLADAIRGAEERAHIVLSGRITDWEFRRDLKSLNEWLSVSIRDVTPGKTPEEELLRIIRQEQRGEKEPNPEQPFVGIMLPLDRERIRLFADAKGTPDLNKFLERIEAADLWHFASRPLDLDWLVKFWQSEGRLGSLAEMIERSVSERLKETNTDRVRSDALDDVRALQAVERIGAAMVFGRRTTVAIPDSEVSFTSDAPLDLPEVLPDWSADDRGRLLSRPIFDPATIGRARFHNDNDGVVRGYLAAQWLRRLSSANLRRAALFELLFAKSYGLEVIKPSLNETAAWLAIWDKDVANEIVRRSPMLLLGAGDPAVLPPDVRRNALANLIKEMTASNQEDYGSPWWDNDKIRRFAQPDLGSTVASLYPRHRAHKGATQLLLRIAWLGALQDCASLAQDAAFDASEDSTTRILAGRVVLVAGDEKARREYAEFVLADRSRLPKVMLCDALDLFPSLIGVNDLLAVVESMHDGDDDSGHGFEWEGPRLVDRLDSASDLERLLCGLLTQMGGDLGEYAHHPATKREEVYFPSVMTAALRLLMVSPQETAPEAAIDAVLRIANRQHYRGKTLTNLDAALVELHRTRSRRRVAFRRVVESLRRVSHAMQSMDSLRQIEWMGYQSGLKVEDVEWLLEDGLSRGEHDRRLAINSALAVHDSAGAPPGLLDKIAAAARTDEVASETYDNWMQPPPRPPTAQQLEMEREIQDLEVQNASQQAKLEQSWIDFVRRLRSDPARIERLKIPSVSCVNRDLCDLWHLLDLATRRRARHAIDSVSPLLRIVGADVAEAARQGLIAHWRGAVAILRSQRSANDRNTAKVCDLMGIVGVSLEAATSSSWADQLSTSEATIAAGYATLEINGFPQWLASLAAAHPVQVRTVLVGEILDELSHPELTYYATLSAVASAEDGIAMLVAPALLGALETQTQIPAGALPRLLEVLVRGLPQESAARFETVGMKVFESEPDVVVATQYLGAVFSLAPAVALRGLKSKLASLSAYEQGRWTDRFLVAVFGESLSGPAFKARDVPPETLEELVRLTFKTNSPAAESRRPSGKMDQIDENDRTYHAGTALFNRFANAPGAATFLALLELQEDPSCPIAPARLRALARHRAVQDSESAPWLPAEALAFEQHHESQPRTPKDLQSVLLSRLEDMQHDLLHGDFVQGGTLKTLRHEIDVQNWVADRLRLKQGRSFSVEREIHVGGEKEPDVRVRAKATGATVAMEIKVAESWTLKELENALELQLCGQYLRAKDGRHGVLLPVHQNARARGWKDNSSGAFLSFPQVVARLSERAALIAGARYDAPQSEVCALDVSSCLATRRRSPVSR